MEMGVIVNSFFVFLFLIDHDHFLSLIDHEHACHATPCMLMGDQGEKNKE